mgnify:CR=1 FL=1
MKSKILFFMIIIFFLINKINGQTIFYNEDGFKVDKSIASSYRVYKFDKSKTKGTFKEFNIQNKLLSEGGFLKFDFLNKNNEILNGEFTEYRNDSVFKLNFRNNIPIKQVNVYDNKNRIISTIPIKNGKINYDDPDAINYYYYKDRNDTEYYTVQGEFKDDLFYGKVTFFYEIGIQTYYLFGENFYDVLNKKNIAKCDAFNFFKFKDKNKNNYLSFTDNFNCGQNENWVMFYAMKEMGFNYKFIDLKNEKLYLEITEDNISTDFRLLNPTPYKLEKNDFDIKINIISQEKCISGITINNKNYLTNNYTDQYRIGFTKDASSIIFEKMINEVYVEEEIINVTGLIKEKNELRLLKESNELKIILNNSLVYTHSNYTYSGESIGLYCFGKKGTYTYLDDFSLKIKVLNEESQAIKMKKNGTIYEIPITLNDVIKTDFIIDTGASNVSITPDLALLLIRSGTITTEDWLKDKYYKFADGSTAKSRTFKIKNWQ